jgi:hypothetical protein
MNRTATLLATLSVLLAPALAADTIYRTDGRTIKDVKIVSETVTEVSYKKGNDTKTIDSANVLSVEFATRPRLLDEAEEALDADDLFVALEIFDEYVDGQIRKPSERRHKWAPAYAAHQAIQIRITVADNAGVISAAKRLINNYGDSRYVPGAYLAQADALLRTDKAAAAQKALSELQGLVESKNLSKRWALECSLGQIRADTSSSGKQRRAALQEIAASAGSEFPTVRNKANVSEGETYLAEWETSKDDAKRRAMVDSASELFARILEDPNADNATLAGAFAGQGLCLYLRSANPIDAAGLEDAAKNFLRVIIVYKDQSQYVPKSLFYAMRCFDLLGQRERKFDMLRDLKNMYPGSQWASEADRYK